MNTEALTDVTIRDLTPDDRDSVIRIDALHSGEPVPEYEREVFSCGWIFSVAVDPDLARRKIAARLVVEAKQRFRDLGMQRIRTMVRRNDVAVLSFFRAQEFIGGSFVQLELDLMDDDDDDQEESS